MTALFLALLLGASSLAPAGPLAAAAHPDFSGTWTLDRARSTDLPPTYANVRAQRLVVAQDDARLSVRVEIDAGAAEPERFDFTYPLDGTEGETTARIRTAGGMVEVPAKVRGARGEDGRLRLSITREVPMRGETVRVTGTEEWVLGEDGRTLTVHRVEQLRGGEVRFTMVFARG